MELIKSSVLPPSRSQKNVLVNRLRLKELALLATLGKTSNLHRAAEALNITQPTATKMLLKLEQSFGFALFERLPRGMQATALGAQALVFATRLLADVERFSADLDIKRQGGYGQLVIGAIMGAAPDLMAQAVAALKVRRPLLQLKVMGETSDQVVGMLERREIDIAVGRFSKLMQHNAFRFEALSNEMLYVVVRAAHPLSRCAGVLELNHLESWPWVLPSLSSPLRESLEQEFFEVGMNTPANTVECGSVLATLQLLQASEAIAVLPESVVRDHLLGGLLVCLPVKLSKQLSGFGILTRKEEQLSQVAEEFALSLRGFAAALNQKTA